MTKPKYKKGSFDKLIKEQNFYYVNSDLNEEKFPIQKTVQTKNWKLIKMEKYFSSQQALDKIKSEACRPANAYELLLWYKNHGEENMPKGIRSSVLAFGQLCACSGGDHGVPIVRRGSDGDWRFSLGYFEGDWHVDYCLLCFCDSTLKLGTSSAKSSDTLTLSTKNMIRENLEKIRDLTSEIEGMLK